jgi:hypothetical protein
MRADVALTCSGSELMTSLSSSLSSRASMTLEEQLQPLLFDMASIC